jgi:hypothetical protein
VTAFLAKGGVPGILRDRAGESSSSTHASPVAGQATSINQRPERIHANRYLEMLETNQFRARKTKNKLAGRGAFFDAEKCPSKNHKNALNHHELTTKKPSKTTMENADPNEKRP